MYYIFIFVWILLFGSNLECNITDNNSKIFSILNQANNLNGYAFLIPFPKNNINIDDGWNVFHNSVFKFLSLLESAKNNKVPLIIVIPDEYNNVTPICKESPWIEGARCALAWASAYHRFGELGNIDVRILVLSQKEFSSKDIVDSLVSNLISLNIKDISNKPEENIKNRIFSSKNIPQAATKKFILKEIQIADQPSKFTTVINPNLANCPTGKQRILVTGGSGFIGSHAVKDLLVNDHQVIVLDNFMCSSIENLKPLLPNKNLEVYTIDVSQPFDVTGQIDGIIHLASVPSPTGYYTKPKETMLSGLHGTKNCLELALKKKARFVFASSSEVYGDPEVHPQPESYVGRVNPIGMRSQYDQSKRGGETITKLYFEKYKIDVRIVRIFNTYGPNMDINDGRVVTNFIKAMLNNEPMMIYGTGLQTRSFAYVSDTVDGILKTFWSDKIGTLNKIEERVFNVGNPVEFTINELAQKINKLSKKYFNLPAKFKNIELFDKDDPKLRRPDITYVNKVVGFNPQITLDEGLEKTFLYFKGQQKK